MIERALVLTDAKYLPTRCQAEKMGGGSHTKLDGLISSGWGVITRMKGILGPYYTLAKRTGGTGRAGRHQETRLGT
jgi:hypothetical protein